MNNNERQFQYGLKFGSLPEESFDEEYLRLTKLDLAEAQANLDQLPETERRGLTMETLRHFKFGYLPNWINTKCRAKFVCGTYVDEKTGEAKRLPPPSERIIIPTASMEHFNAVATPLARREMEKKYWKQHSGTMELFCDPDALKADTIVVVEGEIDCASIWQATQGAVAAVAILGCANQQKTLGARLHELKGKKFIVLLDADSSGQKNAKKLCDMLIKERHPAEIRYLYEYLPTDLKKAPQAVKVDANEILFYHGEELLDSIMKKILDSTCGELDRLATQIEQEQTAEGTDANPSLILPRSVQSQKTATKNFETDTTGDDAKRTILDALKFVPASSTNRDEWWKIGCVMYRYGFGFSDFNEWSNDGDPRYSYDVCKSQWQSMKTDAELKGGGFKIGTVIDIAKKYGYKPKGNLRGTMSDDDRKFYLGGLVTDLANARRLERFCGDRVHWLTDEERWTIYSGGVWRRGTDTSAAVLPFVTKFADFLLANTNSVDETQQKRAKAIAFKFQKRDSISAAVTMMKGCDSILITADDLDRHSNLLCVQNGVVDLETGKFYQHDPKYLITQQCRAAYDENAKSELVDNFFKAIQPDEETCRGLLRWIGYCLSGEVKEEKFMVWTGGGGNGKGVLSGVLLEMLGTYAVGLAPTALLKSNKPFDADKPTTSLNGLELARFAISEEMPADGELELSLIKNLSGGDRINLRRLHNEYRLVKPTAKLNISGNYTPKIENVHDKGLLRRMLNMPFLVTFGTADNPADPNLKKKLLLPENLSALLRMLVAESVNWYRDGLIISSQMKQETKRHLEQNDFISDFISDNYERGENLSVKAKDFIDDLKREYPRECGRFKRNDLIRLISETSGITYGVNRTNNRVFKGIGKPDAPSQQSFDDFRGEPVPKDELPPFVK